MRPTKCGRLLALLSLPVTSFACGDRGAACGTSGDCTRGEFCGFPEAQHCGEAGNAGLCQPRPGVCTTDYAPVCGCDRRTYPNDCVAHARGISVGYQGACGDPSMSDGGGDTGAPTDADADDAGPAEDAEPIEDADSGDGTVACPETRSIVCGCDGQSYHNECYALRAGTSVCSNGACGNRCQPYFWADLCDSREFCNGNTGWCEPRAEACSESGSPVCGCDLQTYPSACLAYQAGTGIRSQGACPSDGTRRCDAFNGQPCGPDEFCDIGGVIVPNTCNSYDGVCAPRPTSCPPLPLTRACMITGATAGSECEANMRGISAAPVAHCGFPFGRCGAVSTWGYIECAADQYCGLADPYCGNDIFSYRVCKSVPASCDDVYAPVCTCGGPFANGCEAARARQDLAARELVVGANGQLSCGPIRF